MAVWTDKVAEVVRPELWEQIAAKLPEPVAEETHTGTRYTVRYGGIDVPHHNTEPAHTNIGGRWYYIMGVRIGVIWVERRPYAPVASIVTEDGIKVNFDDMIAFEKALQERRKLALLRHR